MSKGIQGILAKIFKFNKDRGLLEKGFSYDREAGFLLSESLELINHKKLVSWMFGDDNHLSYMNQDELASWIVKTFKKEGLSELDKAVLYTDTVEDQFVFGSGGKMKLGLPMGECENITHIVCDANLQKTGGTTADGKQKKGTAFKSPDEKIRERLKLLPQFKGQK